MPAESIDSRVDEGPSASGRGDGHGDRGKERPDGLDLAGQVTGELTKRTHPVGGLEVRVDRTSARPA